jgi:hypothetical protein
MDRPLITGAEVTLDYCDTERAASFWSVVFDLAARPVARATDHRRTASVVPRGQLPGVARQSVALRCQDEIHSNSRSRHPPWAN